MLIFLPGVKFTKPLAQSANAMAWHSVFGTKDAIQFHQQNCTQLIKSTQLEITPNFYALVSTFFSYKFKVRENILAQNLLKLMLKLTLGVNFIISSFYIISCFKATFCVCIFLLNWKLEKNCL